MTNSAMVLLLKGLDLLVLGITMSPAIRVAFSDITMSVQAMVVEGRNPTTEEWRKLDILRDTVHRGIQEAGA